MRTHGRIAIFLAVVLSAAAASLVPASALARSSAAQVAPTGNAWGSYVRVGGIAESGHTALAVLGCGGRHDSNDVAAVHVPGLSTGVIRSKTDATDVNGDPGSRSVNVTHNINLLDGLITADAVRAVSRTSYDGSRFTGNGRGSEFVGLEINGKPYSVNASGRVNLGGIGYAVLNHESQAQNGAVHRTDMVSIHVTRDVPRLHLSAGTVMVVAHALSSVHPAGGILGGYAFGSRAVVSGGAPLGANAGKSALVYVSCDGTDGKVVKNQVANLGLSPAFSLFNVQSTAQGEVQSKTASLKLTDTVEEADLLQGLIHAKAIKAVAAGSTAHGERHFTSRGSQFGQLLVAGFPQINLNVSRNTRVSLPGLGVLWLHRVIRSDNQIEVRMIELQVRKPNTLGLPVGADVQVGVARAAIRQVK
jgi:hypothetical protein